MNFIYSSSREEVLQGIYELEMAPKRLTGAVE